MTSEQVVGGAGELWIIEDILNSTGSLSSDLDLHLRQTLQFQIATKQQQFLRFSGVDPRIVDLGLVVDLRSKLHLEIAKRLID